MVTDMDIAKRLNEIKAPGGAFGKLSTNARFVFLYEQGWLILVRGREATMLTVVRQRKDGVWENMK